MFHVQSGVSNTEKNADVWNVPFLAAMREDEMKFTYDRFNSVYCELGVLVKPASNTCVCVCLVFFCKANSRYRLNSM